MSMKWLQWLQINKSLLCFQREKVQGRQSFWLSSTLFFSVAGGMGDQGRVKKWSLCVPSVQVIVSFITLQDWIGNSYREENSLSSNSLLGSCISPALHSCSCPHPSSLVRWQLCRHPFPKSHFPPRNFSLCWPQSNKRGGKPKCFGRCFR